MDEDSTDAPATASDGGADPGFDEAALYRVIRRAVEDAILDAVGTLLLVGIGFVFVWVGTAAAFQTESTVGVAVGVAVAAVGVSLAAATLDVIPPARTWLRR